MILAPFLLLLSAQLPDIGTSPLAEPETIHDWQPLGSDEDGLGWFDRTFEDTIPYEGVIYPVVLIRMAVREGDKTNIGDALIAVDCEESRMAIFAGWLQKVGEVKTLYDSPNGLAFDVTEPPFEEEDIILFRQACGEDWTP